MLSDRRDHPTANEVIKVVFNPQEHRARSASTCCFKQELAEIEVLGQEHKAPVSCVLEKHGIVRPNERQHCPNEPQQFRQP